MFLSLLAHDAYIVPIISSMIRLLDSKFASQNSIEKLRIITFDTMHTRFLISNCHRSYGQSLRPCSFFALHTSMRDSLACALYRGE